MTDVKITERGWAGHFICAERCRFRRNTLIEYGDKQWVVSTVGCMVINNKVEPIGHRRWFETMAFVGKKEGEYIDADVSNQIYFDADWGIFGDSWEEVIEEYPFVDNIANKMHEQVVEELAEKIKGGDEDDKK